MKKFILFSFLFLITPSFAADVKISALPSITNAQLAQVDVIPVVDISANATKKIAIGQLDLRYLSSTGAMYVSGTLASPIVVSAAGGVPIAAKQRQMVITRSGVGATVITANPQIPAGTIVGQELVIEGTSDINYIIMNDGNGLALNGAVLMTNKAMISFIWDGAVWAEQSRR